MKVTRELLINVGLAFVAGFATTFYAFLNSTPKAPEKAALIAALSAALFAGVRGAVGFIALNAKQVPAIPVDE